MSDFAIRVDNLGKEYRLGGASEGYKTLRDSLSGLALGPVRALQSLAGRGGEKRRDETFWALKDVSFDVKRGEVVGIIGRNGAGKSTLLKVLSRITEPTKGCVRIRGRVGSLLEVGTGFHPELSGRENIFLNGAILGMSRSVIEKRFDEIVDFAEVEKFIDTPVKRYSSGMYLRLAFAVAAHLEPEILVVDEVLAVGDAAFQKKCLGKMGDVAKQGRTVLFVSHNMTAVESLCGRAVALQRGEVVEVGPARQVVANYLNSGASNLTEQLWERPEVAPGNDSVRLHRVCVRPESGLPGDSITVRTPLLLEFEYWNFKPDARLNLSLHVYSTEGVLVFVTASMAEEAWGGKAFPSGLFRTVCRIPSDLLNDKTYSVELLVVENAGTALFRFEEALVFEVNDSTELRGEWHGEWPGTVRPALQWSTEFVHREPVVTSNML